MFYFVEIVQGLAFVFAVIGAGIMISTGLVSTFRFFFRGQPWSIESKEIKEIEKIRLGLGHKIIFGLEFLIIGDILQTLINPSLNELYQLGGIVLIRTVLSFFISRELEDFHKARSFVEKAKDMAKGE